eukprot:TRINITY_DN11414_c1_g1_i1.p1 TRINITY_DN11414_c1_g1~~TRINITY_DN11414_c1_g1_i1.p1  ORF type:complete len:349 (-),score=35.96 TRINITY_DN11414_c1_g1_i1:91-1095(-)
MCALVSLLLAWVALSQGLRPLDDTDQHVSANSSAGLMLQLAERSLDCAEQHGTAVSENVECGRFDQKLLASLHQELTQSHLHSPLDVKLQDTADRSHLPDAHIAVVTVCYPDHAAQSESFPVADAAGFGDFCETSRRNKQQFCDRHGCQLLFIDHPLKELGTKEAAYNKWIASSSAFLNPDISHVALIDADALFMNFDKSITSLLPQHEKQITLNGDSNALLNDGIFILKKGDVAKQLIKEVLDIQPAPSPWGGQSSLIYIFTGKLHECRSSTDMCNHLPLTEEWSRVCDVRDKREMNSYISDFQPGDFILHFAGQGQKFRLMKEYSARVHISI